MPVIGIPLIGLVRIPYGVGFGSSPEYHPAPQHSQLMDEQFTVRCQGEGKYPPASSNSSCTEQTEEDSTRLH